MSGGQTITEKILSRICGRRVSAGEVVMPEAELITVHDWYTVNAFRTLDDFGVTKLHDASRVLLVTDHEPLAVSPQAFARQHAVRGIAQRFGVAHRDAGRGGLGHVFPVEEGLVTPGMFIFAYDPHVTNYGAIGALGVAVLTEIPEVLACGSVWLPVPETLRVDTIGALPFGVFARDAAQKLIGSHDAALFEDAVVEYGGPGLASLNIDARHTLCNTPVELGAVSSLVEPDALCMAYVQARAQRPVHRTLPDADAVYRARITLDLSAIAPQVALPPTPDNVVDVTEVAGKAIGHAFIGSCASGMLDDLRVAAAVLRGRQVAPGVRLIVTPATQQVAADAAAEGLIEVFMRAGAMVTAPGCGVCAGGRIGGVAAGEVSIGTGTRNEPGRLGAHEAVLHIAGPATVAASAVAGSIADPRPFLRDVAWGMAA
ncbi:3-isopropylmalate dehydratase large subunit [Falsiroseomonas stagni]|uniref:3-isopropylmalate/(R)-2-methylmalate dehydratase large subunit n=1 Tax=Falsiroseomonas stagni DSM 19981 TaxID=1123062 RepID=A0A1I4AWP4_9PROT|nr:aconitase family protein [Falsiroseomonas stagni]SFK61022.1 3-isopropylmalate/(R)-2-methylmalate dehydratase large subunit [Falsiroseomonas stagni DSM 19981]